jgi:hypothetical protein
MILPCPKSDFFFLTHIHICSLWLGVLWMSSSLTGEQLIVASNNHLSKVQEDFLTTPVFSDYPPSSSEHAPAYHQTDNIEQSCTTIEYIVLYWCCPRDKWLFRPVAAAAEPPRGGKEKGLIYICASLCLAVATSVYPTKVIRSEGQKNKNDYHLLLGGKSQLSVHLPGIFTAAAEMTHVSETLCFPCSSTWIIITHSSSSYCISVAARGEEKKKTLALDV